MGEVTFTSESTVTLVDRLGSDMSIVDAAVVSTGADASTWPEERVDGLISRLMRDRHGAPFEHVVFTFWIRAPLFTARQMMRHRVASFNEVSGRYRTLESVFYVPPPSRPITQVGKTMDYEFVADEKLSAAARVVMTTACQSAYQSYSRLLEAGVAKEVARMVLPVNIMTEFFVTINLRSLFNMMSLRGKETGTFPSHPQYEIAEVVAHMERHVDLHVPRAYRAFVECGRVQP